MILVLLAIVGTRAQPTNSFPAATAVVTDSALRDGANRYVSFIQDGLTYAETHYSFTEAGQGDCFYKFDTITCPPSTTYRTFTVDLTRCQTPPCGASWQNTDLTHGALMASVYATIHTECIGGDTCLGYFCEIWPFGRVDWCFDHLCNGDPKNFDWQGPLDLTYHVMWDPVQHQVVPDASFGPDKNGLVLNWDLNFNSDIAASCWVQNGGDFRSAIEAALMSYQTQIIEEISQSINVNLAQLLQQNINDPVDVSYNVVGCTVNLSYTPWDMQFYNNLTEALYRGVLFVVNDTSGATWTYPPSVTDASYTPPESAWAAHLAPYDYALLEAVRVDVTVFRALLAAGNYMQIYNYDSIFQIKDGNLSAYLAWETPVLNFTSGNNFNLTIVHGNCHIICLSNCSACSPGNVMFNFTFANISALGTLIYAYTTDPTTGVVSDGIYPAIQTFDLSHVTFNITRPAFAPEQLLTSLIKQAFDHGRSYVNEFLQRHPFTIPEGWGASNFPQPTISITPELNNAYGYVEAQTECTCGVPFRKQDMCTDCSAAAQAARNGRSRYAPQASFANEFDPAGVPPIRQSGPEYDAEDETANKSTTTTTPAPPAVFYLYLYTDRGSVINETSCAMTSNTSSVTVRALTDTQGQCVGISPYAPLPTYRAMVNTLGVLTALDYLCFDGGCASCQLHFDGNANALAPGQCGPALPSTTPGNTTPPAKSTMRYTPALCSGMLTPLAPMTLQAQVTYAREVFLVTFSGNTSIATNTSALPCQVGACPISDPTLISYGMFTLVLGQCAPFGDGYFYRIDDTAPGSCGYNMTWGCVSDCTLCLQQAVFPVAQCFNATNLFGLGPGVSGFFSATLPAECALAHLPPAVLPTFVIPAAIAGVVFVVGLLLVYTLRARLRGLWAALRGRARQTANSDFDGTAPPYAGVASTLKAYGHRLLATVSDTAAVMAWPDAASLKPHRFNLVSIVLTLLMVLLLLAVPLVTHYYSGFVEHIRSLLDIDTSFLDLSHLQRIYGGWGLAFVAVGVSSVVVCLGLLVVVCCLSTPRASGAAVGHKAHLSDGLWAADEASTRAAFPHALTFDRLTRNGCIGITSVFLVVALLGVFVVYGFFPFFDGAAVLQGNITGGNGSFAPDAQGFYEEAAAGQTYLIKEVIIEHENGLFIYVIFGLVLGIEMAVGVVENNAVTKFHRQARGFLWTFSMLNICSLYLGAMFCAISDYHTLHHGMYYFVLFMLTLVTNVAGFWYSGQPGVHVRVLTGVLGMTVALVLALLIMETAWGKIQKWDWPVMVAAFFGFTLLAYSSFVRGLSMTLQWIETRVDAGEKGTNTRTFGFLLMALLYIICVGVCRYAYGHVATYVIIATVGLGGVYLVFVAIGESVVFRTTARFFFPSRPSPPPHLLLPMCGRTTWVFYESLEMPHTFLADWIAVLGPVFVVTVLECGVSMVLVAGMEIGTGLAEVVCDAVSLLWFAVTGVVPWARARRGGYAAPLNSASGTTESLTTSTAPAVIDADGPHVDPAPTVSVHTLSGGPGRWVAFVGGLRSAREARTHNWGWWCLALAPAMLPVCVVFTASRAVLQVLARTLAVPGACLAWAGDGLEDYTPNSVAQRVPVRRVAASASAAAQISAPSEHTPLLLPSAADSQAPVNALPVDKCVTVDAVDCAVALSARSPVLRIQGGRIFAFVALVFLLGCVIYDATSIFDAGYSARLLNKLLSEMGLVVDKDWKGLADTERAWDLHTRLSWGLNVLAVVCCPAVLVLEMYRRYKWADRVCVVLLLADIIASVLNTTIDFEKTLHIEDIITQMDCAPQFNVLMSSMVAGGFGQLMQLLVSVKLGPLVLSGAVAVLRAANLVVLLPPPDLADESLRRRILYINNCGVVTYKFSPVLSLFISCPIFLVVSQYSSLAPITMLVSLFWFGTLAGAMFYNPSNSAAVAVNYVLTVWVVYFGSLAGIVMYFLSLYDNPFVVLRHVLSTPGAWVYLLREVADVMIGLRVVGQLALNGFASDQTADDDDCGGLVIDSGDDHAGPRKSLSPTAVRVQ